MTLAKVMSVHHTNGTIIAEISKRAKASYNESDGHIEHWLTTGKLWASELRAEGLITTAETVEKHIKWFEDNS